MKAFIVRSITVAVRNSLDPFQEAVPETPAGCRGPAADGEFRSSRARYHPDIYFTILR